MKFCVDCKHCTNQDKAGTGFTCDGGIVNLVTGLVSIIPCEEARMHWQCGPDAKMFKEADGVGDKRIARERETRKPEAPEVREAKAAVSQVRDMKPGKSD